jgi:hypothetical protein
VNQLTLKNRVYHFEGLVNFLSDFGTSQDDLATDEDQKNNLGLDHSVDQTREQLGLVRAEVVMARCKTLQTDRELDITGANNILDLEVREFCVESKLLDDTSVFARRQLGIIFRFGTSNYHLARGKDQSSGLGLTDTHNDSGKTLQGLARDKGI